MKTESIYHQIDELNETVRCKVAPSRIHGVGVFAMRNLKKGDRLYICPAERKWFTVPYEKLNKLRPEVRELILSRWASIINGSYFLSPNDDCWLLLFCNHSDNPNYDVKTDTALRDIKAGEEVTEDYRPMINSDIAFPFLKKPWYKKFI